MSNLQIDLAEYLVANGIGTGDGKDIFRDFTPDTPDNIVILYEYAGSPLNAGIDAANRSIQVRVRDKSYASARARINSIYRLLHTPEDMVKINLPNERWMVGTARQSPYKLMEDSVKRTIFAFNYAVLTYTD
jgi:hypothetical protein